VASPDFIGVGWAFPITSTWGRITSNGGEDRIHQSMTLILATTVGERVMLPSFGSRLKELVFAPVNSATLQLASTYAREALEQWEHRIVVDDVSTGVDRAAANRALITVTYHLRDTNIPGNMVYPFYLSGGI